jgi:hypothetical protein
MRIGTLTVLLLLGTAAPSTGQRIERVTVAPTTTSASVALTWQVSRSSLSRPAKAAAIGAAVGGIAGLLYSYVRTHRPEITDHSEDGYVYIIAVPVGVFTGFWLGALVGKLTERPNGEF